MDQFVLVLRNKICHNLQGCGKTTLAKKLAKTWKCELVNGMYGRQSLPSSSQSPDECVDF